MGGVPKAIVSDNLKAAVSKVDKYAPQVNKTLKDFALHYGCVIAPARPYAPQDKALVEGAVKLVSQRIFYPLSKHTFFSVAQLNERIAALLEGYNDYKFSQTGSTRSQEFISIEKGHLSALPPQRYLIKSFKRLKVQKMGYVYLSDDKHYYSVPYRYIGQYTEVQYTRLTVEIFHDKQRIATHKRDVRPGKYSTHKDHLSSAHKAYSQWNLGYFQNKALSIGATVKEYITRMILERPYPEVAYKQAQGILMLVKQYPKERIASAGILWLKQIYLHKFFLLFLRCNPHCIDIGRSSIHYCKSPGQQFVSYDIHSAHFVFPLFYPFIIVSLHLGI